MSAMHKCPIAGCETRVLSSAVMCGHHWSRLPDSLRRQVNDVRRQHGTDNVLFKEARKEAIAALEERKK